MLCRDGARILDQLSDSEILALKICCFDFQYDEY